MKFSTAFIWIMLALAALACNASVNTNNGSGNTGGSGGSTGSTEGELAIVEDIIDGDTIDVDINGVGYRVRYIGVNTPERDEDCYRDATNANAGLVEGQTVWLVTDVSNTDRYGRLLRYVYVGDVFVNAMLVAQGYAEAREYRPDTGFAEYFNDLEIEARNAERGCWPTGVFD